MTNKEPAALPKWPTKDPAVLWNQLPNIWPVLRIFLLRTAVIYQSRFSDVWQPPFNTSERVIWFSRVTDTESLREPPVIISPGSGNCPTWICTHKSAAAPKNVFFFFLGQDIWGRGGTRNYFLKKMRGWYK
jgi:hypothetical protein